MQPAFPGTAVESPFQRLGFFVAQIYLFQLVSRTTEFVDPDQRLHLVLLAALLALGFVLLAQSIRNAFDNKIGLALAAFTGWAIFELPFSSWRGGSFHGLVDSWVKSYLTYIIVVALISNLKELRGAFTCIALAAATIVLIALKFGVKSDEDGRFMVSVGSLGNSNDLAMVLLIGLPFLIYVASDKQRHGFLRVPAALFVPLLLYLVLKTGSRSAVIEIAVLGLMLFFRSGMMRRLLIAGAGVVIVVVVFFSLPKDLRDRYATLLSGSTVTAKTSSVAKSASLSEENRKKLMGHALILTAEHPLFGVGMDQFQNASADLSLSSGEAPLGHTVHSFLLLVAAETGVPGVILYTCALVFSFTAVVRASRSVKSHPEAVLARDLSRVMLYAITGFIVFMLFSPSAYLYHMPLMAALATTLYRYTRKEVAPLAVAGDTGSDGCRILWASRQVVVINVRRSGICEPAIAPGRFGGVAADDRCDPSSRTGRGRVLPGRALRAGASPPQHH